MRLVLVSNDKKYLVLFMAIFGGRKKTHNKTAGVLYLKTEINLLFLIVV